jgi:hypothetical protein
MMKREEVERVLSALGENFLVDIEAVHDGKGGYFIEFTTLANALVNPKPGWVDEIMGYVNTRDYEVGSISPGGESFSEPYSYRGSEIT